MSNRTFALLGFIILAAVMGLVWYVSGDRSDEHEKFAERVAENERYWAKEREMTMANAQLEIGNRVCWVWRHAFGNNAFRGTVSGRQRESGVVTYLRFKDLVYWGGPNHLSPARSTNHTVASEDMRQVPCGEIVVEGEAPNANLAGNIGDSIGCADDDLACQIARGEIPKDTIDDCNSVCYAIENGCELARRDCEARQQ